MASVFPVVVLDANVLIADPWLNKSTLGELRKRYFLLHVPVVPEIAMLEARQHLVSNATQLLETLANTSKPSPKILARFAQTFPENESAEHADPDEVGTRFVENLAATLETLGGFIAPTPRLFQEDWLPRAIEHRPPFRSGDRGAKDYAIWMTILEVARTHNMVSLVSQNSKDFFLDGQLKPELIREAQEVIPAHVKFFGFPGVEDFLSTFDRDGIATREAIMNLISKDQLPGFELVPWISDNLKDALDGLDLDGTAWPGHPDLAEDPRLHRIRDVVAARVLRVDPISAADFRVYFDVAVVGEFWCRVGSVHPAHVVPKRQLLKVKCRELYSDALVLGVGAFVGCVDWNIEDSVARRGKFVPLDSDHRSAFEALEFAPEFE